MILKLNFEFNINNNSITASKNNTENAWEFSVKTIDTKKEAINTLKKWLKDIPHIREQHQACKNFISQSLLLEPELKNKIEEIAKKHEVSQAHLIRSLIKAALNNIKE